VEGGRYELLAGGSSDALPLRAAVEVRVPPTKPVFTRNSTVRDIIALPGGAEKLGAMLGMPAGAPLPEAFLDIPLRNFHMGIPSFGEAALAGLLAELNR
jgi:hypothetical protein